VNSDLRKNSYQLLLLPIILLIIDIVTITYILLSVFHIKQREITFQTHILTSLEHTNNRRGGIISGGRYIPNFGNVGLSKVFRNGARTRVRKFMYFLNKKKIPYQKEHTKS
jgi:hypothetical protein